MSEPLQASDAALADDEILVAVEGSAVRGDHVVGLVGHVRGAGSHAQAMLGLRVVAKLVEPCGECDVCRRGGTPVCPQARRRHSEPDQPNRYRLSSRFVTALDGVLDAPALASPDAAVLVGDAGLAYALYVRADISPRDATIVLGDGPVAEYLLDVLVAKGAPPLVIATDDAITARAARHGLTVCAGGSDQAASLLAALGFGERPRRIFLTEPSNSAWAEALPLISPRTTIVYLAPDGAPHLELPVGLGILLAQEGTLVGVANLHPDLVLEVAVLVARGDLVLATG